MASRNIGCVSAMGMAGVSAGVFVFNNSEQM